MGLALTVSLHSSEAQQERLESIWVSVLMTLPRILRRMLCGGWTQEQVKRRADMDSVLGKRKRGE